MIKIQAKRGGFRRCGVAHSLEPVEYADDHFSPEELAILKAEPSLVVTVTDGTPEKADRCNAAKTIKLVKDAATMADLDALALDEERKSVLAAIDSRRQQLAEGEAGSGSETGA